MLGEEEAQISVFELFKQLLLPYEVEHCHDAKQFVSIPEFTVNSMFQLFFKHCTTLCTIDHVSMILVVLRNRPISFKTMST
jgi:hypothetical protein